MIVWYTASQNTESYRAEWTNSSSKRSTTLPPGMDLRHCNKPRRTFSVDRLAFVTTMLILIRVHGLHRSQRDCGDIPHIIQVDSVLKMFRRGDQDTDSSDDDIVQAKATVEPMTPTSLSTEPGPDNDNDSEDGGDLFGNMLDLPVVNEGEDGQVNTASTVVALRDFPLPKHLSSAFALPKKLLSDLVLSRKATAPGKPVHSGDLSEPEQRMVVTTFEFKEIGRGSRLKRCRLDIVFTPEGTSIAKGTRYVSAIPRENGTGPSGSSTSASGNVTPATTGETSDQLNKLQTGVAGISLSTQLGGNSLEAGDGKPKGTATSPPPPPVLDDYSYMISMESVGCPTTIEAENYVALIALHELTTSTKHSLMASTKSAKLGISSLTSSTSVALRMEYPPINARNLPVPYRDMWDELEAIRRIQEDEESRELWKGLDEVLKIQSTVDSAREGKSEKSAVSLFPVGKRCRSRDHEIVPRQYGNKETTAPTKGAMKRKHEAGQSREMKFDQRIQEKWQRRYQSPGYQKMRVGAHNNHGGIIPTKLSSVLQEQRQTLPIADYREQIVKTLEDNQVVVLVGETGWYAI